MEDLYPNIEQTPAGDKLREMKAYLIRERPDIYRDWQQDVQSLAQQLIPILERHNANPDVVIEEDLQTAARINLEVLERLRAAYQRALRRN
jgi:hypothetical protein